MKKALIFDCFTVEPAGLGVPPYMSSYVRYAYSSLRASKEFSQILYFTIDDFRNVFYIDTKPDNNIYSDPYRYSLTKNSDNILDHLKTADVVVVIAGDAVPSVHLHAVNGNLEEIINAMSFVRGKKVMMGIMSNYLRKPNHRYHHVFDAYHGQTLPLNGFDKSSIKPLSYFEINNYISDFSGLFNNIPWTTVAEIDMYRGCIRKTFCTFCNEPIKNQLVTFRPPEDIIKEISLLYEAGVRHFRMGQQACFYSYYHMDIEIIEKLLYSIRNNCPDLKVLHIDNADPVAVASKKGRKIAKLVAEYCTEGNCSPMGIESFDLKVIEANKLTCTPEVLLTAIENVLEFGAERGELGQCKNLPGLNLIYGLPNSTRRTHFENLKWLDKILEKGYLCNRTNVRKVSIYEGTPLEQLNTSIDVNFDEDFASQKRDILELYDKPMKKKVFPEGLILNDLHSFLIDKEGTWFRRLGSYPIMVVEKKSIYPMYETHSLKITDYEGRYIYGEVI